MPRVLVDSYVPVEPNRLSDPTYLFRIASQLCDVVLEPDNGLIEPGDGSEEGTCLQLLKEAVVDHVFVPFLWRSIVSNQTRFAVSLGHGRDPLPS